MKPKITGNLTEVFSSVEGEGPEVGSRTIFFRFAGCDFGCAYCDTLASASPAPPSFTVHAPLAGSVRLVPNPVSAEELTRITAELDRVAGPHRRVSLTGGEPLGQSDFAAQLARELRGRKFKVVLETRGTLAPELLKVGPSLDLISMDFKIPSATGRPAVWREHKAFLDAARGIAVVGKVVADARLTDEEIDTVIGLVEGHGEAITVILQPVRRMVHSLDEAVVRRLLEAQARMLRHLNDVRLIPQVHGVLGLP